MAEGVKPSTARVTEATNIPEQVIRCLHCGDLVTFYNLPFTPDYCSAECEDSDG